MRSVVGLAVLAALLPACRSGAHVPATAVSAPGACSVGTDSARTSLTVAITEAVDPAHAPVPRNSAERLVFRQLYETLVDVDCEGRVVPALASSWSVEHHGRVWRLRLRGDARLWDGSPVTAPMVLRAWSASPAVAALFARVEAAGESELRIEPRSPQQSPRLLAHAALAVALRTAASPWPVGSGPYRVSTSDDRRVITLELREGGTGAQSIHFRTFASADPRGALDDGVDALITAQPAALDYVRALPGYEGTPLPWSRTYAVLRAASSNALPDSATLPPHDVLLELARDAVRADARPADARPPADCPPMNAQPPAARPSRFIIYPRGDAVARDLAERLVALAWPASRAPTWLRTLLPPDYASAGAPTALGLDPRAVADSLRARRRALFVVPLSRAELTFCDETRAVLGGEMAAAAVGLRLTPLLDARDHLVHRAGLGRIQLDGDGTIRFSRRMP